MAFGKKNIFGNQQIPFQQYQNFHPSQQINGINYNPGLGRAPQQFSPFMSGQGSYPLTQAPGYPSQSFGLQHPLQQPTRPVQGYPPQMLPSQGGYPTQGYAPQGYSQGYGGPAPIQPAWEESKKGGLKGFINNFMAKRKR